MKIDIFSSLELDILAKLAAASKVRSCKQGEIFIHEGEKFPPKLHAVIEGSLLVQKIAISGKETTLRRVIN